MSQVDSHTPDRPEHHMQKWRRLDPQGIGLEDSMSRLSICLDSKHEGSRLPPIILNLEQELLDGTISRSMAIQSLRIYATHADPHEMLAVNDLLQRLEKRSPSN